MDSDEEKMSRGAKRICRQYLDQDEEGHPEVDLGSLSMELNSNILTLDASDLSTHPEQRAVCGPGSSSSVSSASFVPQHSPLHIQNPATTAFFTNVAAEIGTIPFCHTPEPLPGSSRIEPTEEIASATIEIGDLPWVYVPPDNDEDAPDNFSRFAAEDLDSDLLVQEPTLIIDDSKHLYEGALISPMESLTAIMSFVQSEHISGAGLGRLLSLISLHLPEPNNFFKSSRDLFNLLEQHEEPVNISYFCSLCYKSRTASSDLCDTCTDENKCVSMFIHLPLVPQVTRMCKRPNFLRDIEYKFTRVKQNDNNLEDIYDGQAYKAAEKQFSVGDTNLTLTWNTDGLQIFNSSLMSLWPFYFIINELPPNKRFLTENMLIGGIWCGVTKPHPNLSLKHIYHDLKVLQNGITIDENSVCKVFVKLLCGTCDAPARAYFLNMKTHSGFYSCHLCLCRGENSKDTEDVTVFPFHNNFAARTLEQYRDNVNFAVQNRVLHKPQLQNDERCCGIKGPSILSYMLDDLLKSTAIDSMHCIFLGVTRQLLTLFFDKSHKDAPFSLYAKIKTVNERILDIEPPHFLDRMPETVDKLIHWKASMLRAFLFNYALCVLFGVLPSVYFEHLVLFVSGVAMLNTSSISSEDIEKASLLLSSFVQKFEVLYGKRHMSHNLHMLLHLSENVEYLAPLWVTNCFKFEDMNGRLVQLVHGTRHAGLQICSNLSMVTHLPLMVHNLKNSTVKQYCQKLRHKWMQLQISFQIAENLFCVGDLKPLPANDVWMLSEISQVVLQPTVTSIQVFERLYKDGILYVSENYKRTQRVSSYIKYDCRNSLELGNIVTFVKVTTSSDYYAVVKRLQSTFPFQTDEGPVRHLHEIHAPHLCIDVVPVSCLKTVLFKVRVSNTLYVAEPLNNFELE